MASQDPDKGCEFSSWLTPVWIFISTALKRVVHRQSGQSRRWTGGNLGNIHHFEKEVWEGDAVSGDDKHWQLQVLVEHVWASLCGYSNLQPHQKEHCRFRQEPLSARFLTRFSMSSLFLSPSVRPQGHNIFLSHSTRLRASWKDHTCLIYGVLSSWNTRKRCQFLAWVLRMWTGQFGNTEWSIQGILMLTNRGRLLLAVKGNRAQEWGWIQMAAVEKDDRLSKAGLDCPSGSGWGLLGLYWMRSYVTSFDLAKLAALVKPPKPSQPFCDLADGQDGHDQQA